jgi:hypothetical protein
MVDELARVRLNGRFSRKVRPTAPRPVSDDEASATLEPRTASKTLRTVNRGAALEHSMVTSPG